MKILQAVVIFLEDLETILHGHDEVMDTDVRESLHLAVNHYFVWAGDQMPLPSCFGMFSARGDAVVSQAFRRFLENTARANDLSVLPVGQSRLDQVQAVEARTKGGMHYDEFLGHCDTALPPDPMPAHLFQPGEYDEADE